MPAYVDKGHSASDFVLNFVLKYKCFESVRILTRELYYTSLFDKRIATLFHVFSGKVHLNLIDRKTLNGHLGHPRGRL